MRSSWERFNSTVIGFCLSIWIGLIFGSGTSFKFLADKSATEKSLLEEESELVSIWSSISITFAALTFIGEDYFSSIVSIVSFS